MDQVSNSANPTTSLSALAVRLYWLIFGNILLAMMAMLILLEGGTLSLLDAGYAASLALLIGARHLDITRLGGLTTEGEPATMAHFRRYAITTVIAGAAMWGVAHGVGSLMS